jgi:hypothetical protein
VLFLHLSGAVKDILRLDLAMQDESNIAVRFEGQRKQQYADTSAHIIKFKGICKLVEDEEDEDDE